MPKPASEFHTPSAPWEPGAVPGAWTRTLALDSESGDYTGLLRWDPGVDTSVQGPVSHDYWEEVYVLEGHFKDLSSDETYLAGMYACRPPGTPHGPWQTERGVLMLEIRYKQEHRSR